MPRPEIRKRVPPKKVSVEGVARAKVADVFSAGLKEARVLFELKVINRAQYLDYQNFLNQAFANHLKAANGGELNAANHLLSAISKHKREQLSVSTNLDVKKHGGGVAVQTPVLQKDIPQKTVKQAKPGRKSAIKKREGIKNKVQLESAVKRRKKDLWAARFFRRVVSGQTLVEMSQQTGFAPETIRKYLGAEAKKKGR